MRCQHGQSERLGPGRQDGPGLFAGTLAVAALKLINRGVEIVAAGVQRGAGHVAARKDGRAAGRLGHDLDLKGLTVKAGAAQRSEPAGGGADVRPARRLEQELQCRVNIAQSHRVVRGPVLLCMTARRWRERTERRAPQAPLGQE